MKTFKDLEFKPHTIGYGKQAVMEFENGKNISVIIGEKFYSNGIDTYEIMSSLTDLTHTGVEGYLTKEKVEKHLIELQTK